METNTTKATFYIVGTLAACIAWSYYSGRARNLPNGPPGLPFIGAILSLKNTILHHKLTEWSNKYGDFFCFMMGQTPSVVLTSPEAIRELFGKRGAIYSSRPKVSNQASLITQDARIVALPYGDRWRKFRKIYHDLLGIQNAKFFLPFQEYESRQILKNLLNQPDNFWQECTRYSASVTFSLLLGCRLEKVDSLIPREINTRMRIMFNHVRPGAWLVDWIPILDYLPDSLAPWRSHAVAVRQQIMPFFILFYTAMKERVRSGTAPDCFLARIIREKSADFEAFEPPHILATTLGAGTDTTGTTLHWLFRAAVLFPEKIKIAQEEIDRVVGHDRLPIWEDRARLPYVTAIVNETHRWASVAPLAFIHATSVADTYRGKDIPSGANIYGNFYAIHNDPKNYPNPREWMPERYLPRDDERAVPEANVPCSHFAFGIGRRECPGQHVADASLYILVSRLLWAFDIMGNTRRPPPPGYSSAFPVYDPAVFEASVKPRNNSVVEVIRIEADKDRPEGLDDSSIYDPLVAQLPKIG